MIDSDILHNKKPGWRTLQTKELVCQVLLRNIDYSEKYYRRSKGESAPNGAISKDFVLKSKKFVLESRFFSDLSSILKDDFDKRTVTFTTDIRCDKIFDRVWFEFDFSKERGVSRIIAMEDGINLTGFGFDFKEMTLWGAFLSDDGQPAMVFYTKEKKLPAYVVPLIHFCETGCTIPSVLALFKNSSEFSEKIVLGKKSNRRHGKRLNEIGEVVYLIPPPENERAFKMPTLIKNHQIDYQHKWSVRGHWRRVKRFGRDAKGNRTEGKTWVRDFVKGPENKPLINKIRIVK